MSFSLDLSLIKKVCVLQFSSESILVDQFYKSHEWFFHLLRRDLMCIRFLCVDDYIDSPLEWDMEWENVKNKLFTKRTIDVIVKGIIEYDETDALLSIHIICKDGTNKIIEKQCDTKDLLKIEKVVVSDICSFFQFNLSEDENEKISKLPDLHSLCSFSRFFDANLRNGVKYSEAISNAFYQVPSAPFLAHSVSALFLDEFSVSDDQSDLLTLCETSVRSDPEDPQMYWRLARIFFNKNQIQKCIEYAQKGVEVSPAYARNYLILAQAYEEIGDSEKSLECGGLAVNLLNSEFEI